MTLKHKQRISFAALTLWLLVAVVEDDVGGVVDARGQILHGAFAELVNPEDVIIDVRDPVDVILEDVDAERMLQVWKRTKEEMSEGKI